MLLHEQNLDDIVVDKLRLDVPPTDLAGLARGGRRQAKSGGRGRHRHGRQVRADPRFVHLAERIADARRHQDAHARQHPLFRIAGHRALRAPMRCRTWMRSWFPAVSATAASRARSRRFASRARTAFRISASASACSSRSSNTRATSLALKSANSTEFDRATNHPVIALITEWQDLARGQQVRDEKSNLGGSMRLGAQEARLVPGSLAHALYGKESIFERHRHRYEFNNHYLDELTAARPDAFPDSRPTGWSNSSSCRTIRGSWRASSIRSSPRRRATAIRCSPVSSGRRANTAPRCSRGARLHETRRVRGRPGPAVLLDRRPLRDRERGAGARGRRPAARHDGGARASRSSSRPRSTRPTAPPRPSFRGPGIEAGLKALAARARANRRAGAHRRARGHAARRSGRGRRCAADAGVSVPPDQFHRRGRLAGQAREHQEGTVPVALGNAERRRQGALHRQRANHGVRARLLASATTISCPTCARSP